MCCRGPPAIRRGFLRPRLRSALGQGVLSISAILSRSESPQARASQAKPSSREARATFFTSNVRVTGWSRTVSSQISKELGKVVSPKSKLTTPVKKPKATWGETSFVADVEYRDFSRAVTAKLVQGVVPTIERTWVIF